MSSLTVLSSLEPNPGNKHFCYQTLRVLHTAWAPSVRNCTQFMAQVVPLVNECQCVHQKEVTVQIGRALEKNPCSLFQIIILFKKSSYLAM